MPLGWWETYFPIINQWIFLVTLKGLSMMMKKMILNNHVCVCLRVCPNELDSSSPFMQHTEFLSKNITKMGVFLLKKNGISDSEIYLRFHPQDAFYCCDFKEKKNLVSPMVNLNTVRPLKARTALNLCQSTLPPTFAYKSLALAL